MRDPNFYITVAQIIPVLVLALVWESRYLERVTDGKTKDQLVWPPSRMRIWAFLILPFAVVAELWCVLAIGVGWFRREVCWWAIVAVMGGLLATLLVRMLADVDKAVKAANRGEN